METLVLMQISVFRIGVIHQGVYTIGRSLTRLPNGLNKVMRNGMPCTILIRFSSINNFEEVSQKPCWSANWVIFRNFYF